MVIYPVDCRNKMVFIQRCNRSHGCDGPLFKGKYKSVLVGGDGYLLQALRYIHRNTV
jgi:putative transposase